jgi:branched-chain amino acid transport system ATP-binding protein
MLLEVQGLHAYYGESHILRGVSLAVGEGEAVCLLGRNGMGKTTTLRSVMGLATVSPGSVRFRGREITTLRTFERSRLGIGFVPENREIFPDLMVWENLLVGTTLRPDRDRTIPQEIYEYFPILRERRKQRGGSLSGGEQQMLAIARALVADPSLLLIDEFSEGLQPSIVRAISGVVREVNRRGTAVVLVEQNIRLALGLTARCYVLEKGQIAFEGPTARLRDDPDLLRRYLAI